MMSNRILHASGGPARWTVREHRFLFLLAALTTVLGMIPLLTDAFFVALAVTIMFGLAFATVLTLIFVPVLYACFFRIPFPAETTG